MRLCYLILIWSGNVTTFAELDVVKPHLKTEEQVMEFVIGYWFPEMVEIFS
jgi:hypothetical protein